MITQAKIEFIKVLEGKFFKNKNGDLFKITKTEVTENDYNVFADRYSFVGMGSDYKVYFTENVKVNTGNMKEISKNSFNSKLNEWYLYAK